MLSRWMEEEEFCLDLGTDILIYILTPNFANSFVERIKYLLEATVLYMQRQFVSHE